MQIFVQTDRTYTLDVTPHDSIENLKAKIQDKTGISSENQRLMFGGKQLQCNGILQIFNITNFSILHVMPSVTTSTTTSITLKIDLLDILHFIPNETSSIHTMNCNENTTIDSILKELDITFLSESLRIDCNYITKSSYVYSEISDVPLFKIGDIINKQTNTITLSLHFISTTISQSIILNKEFLGRMTQYFDQTASDKRNAFSLNVISQIVSTLSSLKSNDELLYESTICLHKFTKNGIPMVLKGKNIRKLIIPSLFKIFGYKNDGKYMEKIRPVLIETIINIATRGRRCINYMVKILDELIYFVDPCQNRKCLTAITEFYIGVWNSSLRLNNNTFNKITQQLQTLMFYDDDEQILNNTLKAYYGLITKRRHRNFINIQKPIDDINSKLIKEKYLNKEDQNRLIFNGYIYQCLNKIDIEYIPNDIACVMFKYYNCYQSLSIDVIQRLMEIMKKNNTYSRVIKNNAWNLAKTFIPPLSVLVETFSDHREDGKFKFYNNVSKYGLIAAIVKIMNDATAPFVMGYIIIMCDKCGLLKKGKFERKGRKKKKIKPFFCDECWTKKAKYGNIDSLLAKMLDIIEYLLNNDTVKAVCIEEINNNHGQSVLKRIENIESENMSKQQLLRVQQLLADYF